MSRLAASRISSYLQNSAPILCSRTLFVGGSRRSFSTTGSFTLGDFPSFLDSLRATVEQHVKTYPVLHGKVVSTPCLVQHAAPGRQLILCLLFRAGYCVFGSSRFCIGQ